jgi:hypothetical protein
VLNLPGNKAFEVELLLHGVNPLLLPLFLFLLLSLFPSIALFLFCTRLLSRFLFWCTFV